MIGSEKIGLHGPVDKDPSEAHRERQVKKVGQNSTAAPEIMFPNSDGEYIRPDNLGKRFITACKKANIKPHEDGRGWGIHELRHKAASQLLSDRVPMQIVSKTLGHSSIYVTLDVYSHLTDQDSELIATSMNNRYDDEITTN